MRICIATDAWAPQVNGVVTTLGHTRAELIGMGHDVLMLTPEGRRTIACPGYPEIRLALLQGAAIRRELEQFSPDAIHIATEGPIGLAVRSHCRRRGLPFTSSYHTRFPEYVRARLPVPISWTAAVLRQFHSYSTRVLVPTLGMQCILEARGFADVVLWSRGVRTDIFSPADPFEFDLPRPIWINVGRVSTEKNIEAFLDLNLPGSKVVVGDGPDRQRLARDYPDCHFTGYRFGAELASLLAGADVFVFPSKTDTFGLVMLEAMACGLAVAAFPVTGPSDVVTDGVTGVLHDDLEKACTRALLIDREVCVAFARARTWRHATAQFVSMMAPINDPPGPVRHTALRPPLDSTFSSPQRHLAAH